MGEIIGFIGAGVMGGRMTKRLLDAGYDVILHTRTKAKAEPLLEQGARWADEPSDVASHAAVIITMLGYPEDVRVVYLGPGGIIERAAPESLLIDCTTSAPALAVEIANAAGRRSLLALDAPVSGGDVGARDGTLSIMCGGAEHAFKRALPYLKQMGRNISLLGGPGAGQHTKMANQIAVANGMMAVCESLAYAQNAGLDPEKVLAAVSSGAAGSWALSNLAPRILRGDYEPGFYVEHFIKDMEIALSESERFGLELPGLKTARAMYQQLLERHMGRKGTQALFSVYDSDKSDKRA